MAAKVKLICGYAFTVLFILSFGYLFALNINEPLQEFLISPNAFVLYAISFIIFIIVLLKAMSLFKKKTNYIIMWILIAIVLCIQFFLAYTTWMNDFADSFTVHNQAVKMLHTDGKFHIQDSAYFEYRYFQVYSNNVFITILHYLVLATGKIFHFQNAFLIDNFFVMFCIDISILLLLIIVHKEFGIKMVNIFLIFFMTCIPLFSYLFYFYTDTVILPIVSIIIYIYYLYYKENKWLYLVVIGFLFTIGYQIKPNIIILLPAMLIHVWLSKNYKKLLISSITIASIIFVVSPVFTPIYNSFGYERDSTIELPMTHWVMMGLNKESLGKYNLTDVNYSKSFETKEAKKEGNIKIIKERLNEYSKEDFKKLYKEKLKITWTNGTRGYSTFVKSPLYPNNVFDYLFGSRKIIFDTFSQFFHITNLLLICIGAMYFIKKRTFDFYFFINISLFGVMLFHLIWESGERYILIITPMMLLSAIYGMKFIYEYIFNHKLKANNKVRKMSLLISTAILLLSSFSFMASLYKIINDKIEVEDYAVYQNYGNADFIVSEDQFLKQIFKIEKPFNKIMIPVREAPDPSRTYLIAIKDNTTNKVLLEKQISHTELNKETGYTMNFKNTINNKKKMKYSIEVNESSENGSGKELILGTYQKANYNPYPSLKLFVNGEEEKNQNISFFVSTSTAKPIITQNFLYFAFIFIVGFYITMFVVLYRKSIQN